MGRQSKKFTFKHAVGVDIEDLIYLKIIKGECSIAEKLREIISFYRDNNKPKK